MGNGIPLDAGQIEGWKDIPIKDEQTADPLIPLGPLAPETGRLLTAATYFGEYRSSPYADEAHTIEGSLLTLFARQSVARRLLTAEQLLPSGHHLLVLDAYRPYQVQKSLYDFYHQKLKEKYPDKDNAELEAETQEYVSLPSSNPSQPSPHNTGGAVDVVIVRLDAKHEKELQRIHSQLADDNLYVAKRIGLEMRLSALIRHHASMLNFGTAFDHGGEKSALAYYEARVAAGEALTEDEVRARDNRRLLFKAMTAAGFQPYYAEWWHFNAPETQTGAACARLEYATLGGVDLDESNKAHENTRRMVRQQALELQDQGATAMAQTAFQTEILAVVRETGDLQAGGEWPTEIIAPGL